MPGWVRGWGCRQLPAAGCYLTAPTPAPHSATTTTTIPNTQTHHTSHISLLSVQVAAYTNGRSCLSEHDCLLLRHVLWQRPEEEERIYDWLLSRLAEEDTLQQPAYLLSSERCFLMLGMGQ